MLTEDQKKVMTALINDSLDKAEEHWENGGHELMLANVNKSIVAKRESESSKIPGHPTVHDDITVIDEFVAFVADMRDSSQHLLCARSVKRSDVSDLQRVFYETSALLPALAQTVKFKEGNGFFKWSELIRNVGIERNELILIDYLIWLICLAFGWVNWLVFQRKGKIPLLPQS